MKEKASLIDRLYGLVLRLLHRTRERNLIVENAVRLALLSDRMKVDYADEVRIAKNAIGESELR